MKLHGLAPGMKIAGVLDENVELVGIEPLSAAMAAIRYRLASGEVQLEYVDEARCAEFEVVDDDGNPFAADIDAWKLGVENFRVRHAALLDPMLAVASSALRPLPHQIQAVYGEMLPRTRLRFLLADDPGAGKTIMCGLYLKEQMLRGAIARCLIVAPSSLSQQWLRELDEKFDLPFRILTRDLVRETSGSVFDANPLLIAHMDMLKGNEELMALAESSQPWDLVVVDEAHRMSARYARDGIDATARHRLGQRLSRRTEHLLLMTATPHSGDQDAFQAFLALLDEDRFGRRGTVPGAPPEDVMRRLLKEELLTMEGTPLFPERRAATVSYTLSAAEAALYDEVTEYVTHEMDRVKRLRDRGEGRAASAVGFAMTVLQRRLASSPESILRTLERREQRLQQRLHAGTFLELAGGGIDPRRAYAGEDLDPGLEEHEQQLDQASAAETRAELEAEIARLADLVRLARRVRAAGEDRKWIELRSILCEGDHVRDVDGRMRKFIVFTEHRDTLRYLRERIEELPERRGCVVEIHGGVPLAARRVVQDQFMQDPDVTVLLATDAAGEGLNLQAASLMVNYDLPWNPNRIDQRFGRIHRIGQTEVCHLWNLVAGDTREGAVYARLLGKIEAQSEAYRGKVYNVLGAAFDRTPLSELLMDAIQYSHDPARRAHWEEVIDETVAERIPALLRERALHTDVLAEVDVRRARSDMDAAARHRLRPFALEAWFLAAVSHLGGAAARRRDGIEVKVLPEAVRVEGARRGAGLSARMRVTAALGAVGTGDVGVLDPGKPLTEAVAEVLRLALEASMVSPVVLVDDQGSGGCPRIFAALSHHLADGSREGNLISTRACFVELDADRPERGAEVGPVHLGYRAVREAERAAVQRWTTAHPAIGAVGAEPLTALVTSWATHAVVAPHLTEVRAIKQAELGKIDSEVAARLARAEAEPRPDAELLDRLRFRLSQLHRQRQVRAFPVRVEAVALVLPAEVLGSAEPVTGDDLLRAGAEQVVAAETAAGRDAEIVRNGAVPLVRATVSEGHSRWIEVRTAETGGPPWRVSHVDLVAGMNLADDHEVAMVRRAHDGVEIRRVSAPYSVVPAPALSESETAVRWASLWARAGRV